jgi:peroxiredoxin
MVRSIASTTVAALALVFAQHALADAKVGQPAPAFSLKDANGKTVSLADFKGKTVVLEWNNPECPFVRKHYSGNMQQQQGAATAQDVVWLTINSSAPGKQGNLDAAGAKQFVAKTSAKQTDYLLDAPGVVGRAYGAKTTPHMFVIDANGVLRYNGAIDSIASADVSDISKATQYVPAALADLKAGRDVKVATSQPYGCSVKYE